MAWVKNNKNIKLVAGFNGKKRKKKWAETKEKFRRRKYDFANFKLRFCNLYDK